MSESLQTRKYSIPSPRPHRLLLWLLFFPGLIMTLAGVLLLFSEWEQNSPDAHTLMVAYFLSAFGALLLRTIFSHAGKKHTGEISVDSDIRQLTLQAHGRNFIYDFSEFVTYLVEPSQNSRSSHTELTLWLILRDGSRFFLNRFRSASTLSKTLQPLRAILHLPVKDKSGNGLEQSDGEDLPVRISDRTAGAVNYYANRDLGHLVAGVHEGFSPGRMLDLFLVALLFLGTPVFIAFIAISIMSDVFAVFSTLLFCLTFCSVAIFLFAMQFRRREISVVNGELRLKVYIPLLPFISREITMSRQSVRHVRVNRMSDGNLWLAINIKKGQMQALSYLGHMLIGGLPSVLLRLLNPSEQQLVVWELNEYSEDGPGLQDFYALEKIIEQELNLQEEKVEL